MLIGAIAQYFFGLTIFVLSSFLVLLVLVQRGRGGGLTGALGGPGGQSAFGTKAGDLFTRITVGVATAWILLCATAVFMLRGRALPQTGGVDRPTVKGEANPGAGSSSGTGTTGTDNASSGITGSAENLSALPKLELPDSPAPGTNGAASTTGAAPAADSPATPPATTEPAATTPTEPAASETPKAETLKLEDSKPETPPATETPAPTTPATEPSAPAATEPK